MKATQSTLDTADRHPVHLYRWEPSSGAVRGVVQIAHGMSEHAARYDRFAEALTGAGFAVIAHDHRGHGRSVRDERDRGHFADANGWSLVVEDLVSVSRVARSAHPGVPVVLFAHSMGSTIALEALQTDPGGVDGAILSGPVGVAPPLRHVGVLVARIERRRQGRRGRSRLLDRMSFGDFNKAFQPARTPFDWLSRDPAEVDAYVHDPLCGFLVTNQLWLDHLHGLGHVVEPGNLARIPSDLPLLVIAGSADPVSNGTKQIDQLLDRCRSAGMRRVEHRYWPQGRHELVNDIVRDDVTRAVIDWASAIAD